MKSCHSCTTVLPQCLHLIRMQEYSQRTILVSRARHLPFHWCVRGQSIPKHVLHLQNWLFTGLLKGVSTPRGRTEVTSFQRSTYLFTLRLQERADRHKTDLLVLNSVTFATAGCELTEVTVHLYIIHTPPSELAASLQDQSLSQSTNTQGQQSRSLTGGHATDITAACHSASS